MRPLNLVSHTGTIVGEWKTPDALDRVFGGSSWRRRSALAKDGHVPTSACILFGPYLHVSPCVTAEGRSFRKTVTKHHYFRITIKRQPKAGGHNRDSVQADFKFDRFGLIEEDPEAAAPVAAASVTWPTETQPTIAAPEEKQGSIGPEPSRKRKKDAPRDGTEIMPLRVVAETWGPTSGRTKYHQRYLHVEFSDGETLRLVAQDLHPTSSTPSVLVEVNPFYQQVVEQWRSIHKLPVPHPVY